MPELNEEPQNPRHELPPTLRLHSELTAAYTTTRAAALDAMEAHVAGGGVHEGWVDEARAYIAGEREAAEGWVLVKQTPQPFSIDEADGYKPFQLIDHGNGFSSMDVFLERQGHYYQFDEDVAAERSSNLYKIVTTSGEFPPFIVHEDVIGDDFNGFVENYLRAMGDQRMRPRLLTEEQAADIIAALPNFEPDVEQMLEQLPDA